MPAPFRQGGLGDGGADCHSQCAHWLRNDTLQEMLWLLGGGVRTPRPYGWVARSAVRCRRANRGVRPYGSATRGAMGGRPQGSPLRSVTRGAMSGDRKGRPYEWVVGADDPVRPGPITQCLVGQGPCALPWVREKSGSGRRGRRPLRRFDKKVPAWNPPVTAAPCQPPLGKGLPYGGVTRGAMR